jgi:hypothetical protein
MFSVSIVFVGSWHFRTFFAWPLEGFTVCELHLSVWRKKTLEVSDEGASKCSKNLRELQDRAASGPGVCDLHESAAQAASGLRGAI